MLIPMEKVRIPYIAQFLFMVHEGNSYGIFFDNTFKSHFDFAHQEHIQCPACFRGR